MLKLAWVIVNNRIIDLALTPAYEQVGGMSRVTVIDGWHSVS
jgi:hypothetical protein